MRVIILVLVSMVSMMLVTACSNTVQGFGKDMENSGQEIQKAVSGDKKSS